MCVCFLFFFFFFFSFSFFFLCFWCAFCVWERGKTSRKTRQRAKLSQKIILSTLKGA